MEDYTRSLLDNSKEVFVIMEYYGSGGTGSNGFSQTIAGQIKVPKQIWKVIVGLPEGEDNINRITSSTRVIAVDTPNINGVNANWSLYRLYKKIHCSLF